MVVKESKELRLKEGEKMHCDFDGDDFFFKKKSDTIECGRKRAPKKWEWIESGMHRWWT